MSSGRQESDDTRRLHAEHATARALAECRSLYEAAPRILQAIGASHGWDDAALWRVDSAAGLLRCVGTWHSTAVAAPTPGSRGATLTPGQGLPGRAWQSRRPEWLDLAGADEPAPGAHDSSAGARSAFALPIVVGDETLGVLELDGPDTSPPDGALLEMLATIGDQIGQFVVRLRAEEEVTTLFEQSLDILVGRRKIHFQEPRQFFFAELPQIQFYPREQFAWLDRVEAATDEIRDELKAVMRDARAFAPYVQTVPGRPKPPESAMLDNPAWSAFYLWKDGMLVAENAARCPRTLAALEGVPLNRLPQRSPSILFSLLKPHTRIPPHNGLVNTRLICHLPLIVPAGCRFRVGNETRSWEEGKAWVFDDSIDHEAWNDSDQTRVILLFEIWRPELSERERDLVQALFAALDAQSGQKPSWEI